MTNALIDHEKWREYYTITAGGRDHKVKLSGTMDDPYFCGRDVCEILGYKDPKDALQRHIEKEDKSQLSDIVVISNHGLGKENFSFREGQKIYINKKGFEQLLSRSKKCGPDVLQQLVEEFNLNLSIIPRKEHNHLEAITQSFPDVQSYPQFKVGRYRVDLYMEDYDLVIECDEYNHRDRDPQREQEREDFIKSELGCKFIRFNPDCKNFSIFKVIASIHKFILFKETEELKQTIKKFRKTEKYFK